VRTLKPVGWITRCTATVNVSNVAHKMRLTLAQQADTVQVFVILVGDLTSNLSLFFLRTRIGNWELSIVRFFRI
jgi:hypothetical protein